jgi:hypothetical protein
MAVLWLGSVAWPAGMGGLPTIHDDSRSDHSGVVPAKGAFSFFPFVLSGACCFLLCSLAAGLAGVHGSGWQAMLPLLSPGRGLVWRPAFVVARFRGAVWPLA